MTEFEKEVEIRLAKQAQNEPIKDLASSFMSASLAQKYSYNFFWQGRPVIQYPQDIFAMQELIWNVKPDLIVETGIAHGGSIIFSASMLALLDMYEAIEGGYDLNVSKPKRKVLAVDIDIKEHNRKAISEHPLANRITMIQGSSVDPEVVKAARELSQGKKVLVVLDSNHTFEHVYQELQAYAPLVSIGSYCIVMDTIVNDVSDAMYLDRPWSQNNNPKQAAHKWLSENSNFVVDKDIESKILLTVAPDGYLKRIK